jgi:hypothetical protein
LESHCIIFRTKKAATVGPVKSMWDCVHALDLANFTMLITSMLGSAPDPRMNAEGFYFCESGEFAWLVLLKAVA